MREVLLLHECGHCLRVHPLRDGLWATGSDLCSLRSFLFGPRQAALSQRTLDGRNPFRTTFQKTWNALNTSKLWFPTVSKWCDIDFLHPQ